MNNDDKKIIKLILYLCIFGAFCKVGFDVHTYLSIYKTVDDIQDILFMLLAAIVILVSFCFIAITILKSREKKKDIEKTKNKLNRLESKMKSTATKKRNNRR